ncbi:hypothetical protein ETAE_1853 [Edwardsiella piscicida]|uniref:Uncharacterized protein n=1 Tax=Edwardsiella piscicida TaxID=1263550 RepID=A0AAU8PRU8_EDWPI|nr:hypothetical protein ETAE_1853 [Edwardsiella tarda EIB202]
MRLFYFYRALSPLTSSTSLPFNAALTHTARSAPRYDT